MKAGAAVLVVAAALAAGGAAAARMPTHAQRSAILAAFRSQQGDVAVQKVLVSSVDAGYASIGWGFTTHGLAAQHDSVLGLSDGTWKILWTRDEEAPADGLCVYVPAAIARDLLSVGCPPASLLRSRPATAGELKLIVHGFRQSNLTPYATNSTGLRHVCVSSANDAWAGGVARFESGAIIYVFFQHGGNRWQPRFESLLQQGPRPPGIVLLSLASCVGYNPSDYNA
jgi:hypothetical protein